MLCTAGLQGKYNLYPIDIEQFLIDVAWAVHSTHHTVLGSSPWAAIFGQNMILLGRLEDNRA